MDKSEVSFFVGISIFNTLMTLLTFFVVIFK